MAYVVVPKPSEVLLWDPATHAPVSGLSEDGSVFGTRFTGDVYGDHYGGTSVVAGTFDTAGGAQTVTAAELVGGYTYAGAAGGAVNLQLPDAADVAAELTAAGMTVAAGIRLPPVVLCVSDNNWLTAVAGAGGTLCGSAAVAAGSAVIHSVMSSATTIGHTIQHAQESGTHSTTWSGPWAGSIAGDIPYKRIGSILHLELPALSGAWAGNATITADTALPAHLCPPTTRVRQVILVINNGTRTFGNIDIRPTGAITIAVGAALGNFTAGTCGIPDVGIVSYDV